MPQIPKHFFVRNSIFPRAYRTKKIDISTPAVQNPVNLLSVLRIDPDDLFTYWVLVLLAQEVYAEPFEHAANLYNNVRREVFWHKKYDARPFASSVFRATLFLPLHNRD
jgi:hypothetical protein